MKIEGIYEAMDTRRKIVKELAVCNELSINDIASYFDTVPKAVEIDALAVGCDPDSFTIESDPGFLKALTQRRDEKIKASSPEELDTTLKKLGLTHVPRIRPQMRSDFPGKEYKAAYDGFEYEQARVMLDETEGEFSTALKLQGIKSLRQYENVMKLGKEERKQHLHDLTLYLYNTGYNKREISAEVGCGTDKILKIVGNAKPEIKDKLQYAIEDLLVRGMNQYEIVDCLGVTEYRVANIAKSIEIKGKSKDRPLLYKAEDRRKQIFDLYNSGLTQQEVADKLGLSRCTVNASLKQYLADHPEDRDPTQLYRRRNAAEPARNTQIQRINDVAVFSMMGMGIADVSRAMNTNEGTIIRYMNQLGVHTRSDKSIAISNAVAHRRSIVKNLTEAGYTAPEIAKKLSRPVSMIRRDLSMIYEELFEEPHKRALKKMEELEVRRAKELELSLDGLTTNKIVKELSTSYGQTIRDLQMMQSSLRTHDGAIEEVKDILKETVPERLKTFGELQSKDLRSYAEKNDPPYPVAIVGKQRYKSIVETEVPESAER